MRSVQVIKGAILCLIASIAWGAMFPVAEQALKHIDPFYFSFLRYASVSVLLLIWLVIKEGTKALRLERRAMLLWFYGTMAFTVYNFFIFLGQNLLGKSGVILASIMEAMMPLISILILWIHKRARPAGFTMGCMIVAFSGVFMVVTKGDIGFFSEAKNSLLPVLIIFLGVFGWVVYTIGGNSFSNWSPLRYSTLSCVLGTITAGIIVAVMTWLGYLEIPKFKTLVLIRWEMTFMILIAGLAALISWNIGVKYLKPVNGILFINFVPVTTFAISIIQGYTTTMFDVAGTLLIITALICNNLYQRKTLQKRLPQTT